MSFHENCRLGIRNRLATLVKARTTTPASLTTGRLLTRTDAGSFVTDGFHAGDEVVLSGLTGANNGRYYISNIPAPAQLQLELPEEDARTLTNETSTVTVTAGLPVGQADENTHFVPRVGQPWFRESYKKGPEQRRSLSNTNIVVRLSGLYMLSVFYPPQLGALGLDGMTDAVQAVCSPGTLLAYNGTRITIMSCSAVSGSVTPHHTASPESDWISNVLSIRFQADRFVTPLP